MIGGLEDVSNVKKPVHTYVLTECRETDFPNSYYNYHYHYHNFFLKCWNADVAAKKETFKI
jgi:hypothetical protein